jgi:5-methylcytosine-specific restriction endonuclease McrA
MESMEERRRRLARERSRKWRERHPEYAERRRQLYREMSDEAKAKLRATKREAMRKRYAANPEKVLAINKAWYQRNLERMHAYDRAHRSSNLDRIRAEDRARSRARYAADPAAWQAYLKEWRRRNPDRSHAYVRAATIKRRRAIGLDSFTPGQWLALLRDHDGRCTYCGDNTLIEIDHRVPLARGGSNLIENIVPACRRCNRRKHLMTEEEFRALLRAERAQGVDGDGLGERLDGNAGTTRS